ncbi:MAG: substrate-binding domain-containing protein [Treponema sp.]|nr:substrate-binding domain-containing protein [Treponema sp.]
MNHGIAKRRNFLNNRKKNGQRLTIAFTGIADFRSFIGQEYIAGIMKAVNDYDINFINMASAIKYSLFDDIDFLHHYMKKFSFIKKPLIDGLITWASSLSPYMSNNEIVDTFTSLKPMPMVDIGYFPIPGIPSIRIDNNSSMHSIMKHLVEIHGYRNFAFIGSSDTNPHKKRLSVFLDELRKYKLTELEDAIFLCPSMEQKDIAESMNRFCYKYDLTKKGTIDAIVTPSDVIANAVIQELSKRGISVPGHIAVTGFNNQYSGITTPSPVTTIDLEYFKRGYAAVELLIDCIMTPEIEVKSKLMPTSLLIRQSCGCFEKSIVEAGNFQHTEMGNVPVFESESDVRSYLMEKIDTSFFRQSGDEKERLINAIFHDLYETDEKSQLMTCFQDFLQNEKNDEKIPSSYFQQKISDLRRTVLPLIKNDETQQIRMENIFHQLRVLISVAIDYVVMAQKENMYFFNNITNVAIHFASASNKQQIQEVLAHQLSELEISGIILALNENVTADLTKATIEFIYPKLDFYVQEKLPYVIPDAVSIPKIFFPRERPYSYMLEILYYDNKYFGYALLEMGSQNVALYDSVRILLSHAYMTIFTKEKNKNTITSTLLQSDSEILKYTNNSSSGSKKIVSYLMNHLDEMTDLNKMAEELSMSKSHLIRQCKELTGYTVQTLHEMLKIDQAKNLLHIDGMKLSEIATRLGFQNQSYFSAVFKKNTGMSPKNWIQRNR